MPIIPEARIIAFTGRRVRPVEVCVNGETRWQRAVRYKERCEWLGANRRIYEHGDHGPDGKTYCRRLDIWCDCGPEKAEQCRRGTDQ